MASKAKTRDASRIRDRLRSWFGRSKEGDESANIRSPREAYLSESMLRSLSYESEPSVRLQAMKELEPIVTKRCLEEGAIEAIWYCIQDMFTLDASATRREAFSFLLALARAQHAYLGMNRAVLFQFMKAHPYKDSDIRFLLDLLKCISADGKDVTYFDAELAPTLLDWLPFALTDPSLLTAYLALALNCIKFNPACFDESVIKSLIEFICIRACSPSVSLPEVDSCLLLLDTIQTYSFLPVDSVLFVISALCKIVNEEHFCKTTWKLMRNLLSTHFGHTTVYTLCSILNSGDVYPQEALRGAVVFITAALWGPQRIASLTHTPVAVLPSMLTALREHSAIVDYEIAVSMRRLVEKFGATLQLLTWDLIVLVLGRLLESAIGGGDGEVGGRCLSVVDDTLTKMEAYYERGVFAGSSEQLFALVEQFAKQRPERSILHLLTYKAQSISPLRPDWLEMAWRLMETFYRRDARLSVRIKAINVLRNLYSENKFIYAEELIEHVVLRLFKSSLSLERDDEVLSSSLNFLVDVVKECSSQNFFDLMELFEHELLTKLEDVRNEEESEAYVRMCEVVVCGLLEVLRAKWNESPPMQAIFVYEMLVQHVLGEYEKWRGEKGEKIRERVFEFVLKLAANQRRQVGYAMTSSTKTPASSTQSRPAKTVCYSVYLYCAEADYESTPPLPTSPTPGTQPNPLSSAATTLKHFSFEKSLLALTACVQHECSWPVLRRVLTGLPSLLQHRTLIGTDIRRLCQAVLSLCNNEKRVRMLTGEEVEMQEVNEKVLGVLAKMVAYSKAMTEEMKVRVVRAIQSEMVATTSTGCVTALVTCVLELPDVVQPMVRDLIRRLTDMSPPVPTFAIPVLELISVMMRCGMFSSFTQRKDFSHLFNVLLPYTNPYKFTSFIVSLSYHVLFRCFLHCPIPFRLPLARQILQTLDSFRTDPHDASLDSLFDDARTACVEFLAHFSFTDDAAVIEESPLTKFVMAAKQSRSWLLGSRVVTISVCGLTGTGGFCEGCIKFVGEAVKKKEKRLEEERVARSGEMERIRKRHKSAIQKSVTHRPITRVTSLDDSCIASSSTPSVDHGAHSLGDSTTTLNSIYLPPARMNLLPDCEDFGLPACGCWCSGWTQIRVRHAFGESSWILQAGASKTSGMLRLDESLAAIDLAEMLTGVTQHVGETLGAGLSSEDEDDRATPFAESDSHSGLILNLDAPRPRSATASDLSPTELAPGTLPKVASSDAVRVEGKELTRSASQAQPSSTTSLTSEKEQPPLVNKTDSLDPVHVFMQLLFQQQAIGGSAAGGKQTAKRLISACVALPKTESLERSLKNLDRITAYETHKIGVVYAGARQTTEAEMLSNQYGSARYDAFLRGLGWTVALREVDKDPTKTYVGGLNTSGRDGLFAYVWSDQITQVIYHVATMMPTMAADVQCQNKKLHIGNDFACIVFNESEHDFELGTISGQFAYVAIVVQPADDDTLLVTLKAKDEISRWICLKQAVVSDAHAPLLCRQMAMRAELSSKIWHNAQQKNEPYLSNAVERVRQIQRLRERATESGAKGATGGETFVDLAMFDAQGATFIM